MNCPFCNTELTDGDNVCPSCKRDITATDQPKKEFVKGIKAGIPDRPSSFLGILKDQPAKIFVVLLLIVAAVIVWSEALKEPSSTSRPSSPEVDNIALSNPTEIHFSKPNVNYSVIKFERGTLNVQKCLIYIRIPYIISDDEIENISENIRPNEGNNCSPLFIFFYLPDTEPGIDSAWAFSEYNPDFEMGINGMDLETKSTLEASTPNVDNEIVGSWLDTWAFPHKIVISKTYNSYEMTTLFSDGSGETKPLFTTFVDGIKRFYEDPNFHGVYMIILDNGNLAFYDNKGYIYEAKRE